MPLVVSVRRDPRLAEILIGAPAGQPEFPSWAALLGADGAGVPFLRYLPERPGPLGARVERALRERLAEAPSFVAFEGYDTIAVLAAALRSHGTDRARIAASWPDAAVEGTRGPIRFTRPPGTRLWQWPDPGPGRRPRPGRPRPVPHPPPGLSTRLAGARTEPAALRPPAGHRRLSGCRGRRSG